VDSSKCLPEGEHYREPSSQSRRLGGARYQKDE
jgi:hypothetical protein